MGEKLNHKEQPQNAGNFPMKWGSDALAEILRRLDVEYICLNPGASFRGLQDSLVNYLGNSNPQILVCLHEEHAVAMAHGYAKVTGEPMGVLLHANVGLMHAAMAVYDAWCDRVPVFIIGATGPLDAARRRPWIDWIHTARDQASLVRNYTKWDDQPASIPAALESFLRASIQSRTPPYGPVYICLDTTLQETRLDESVSIPDVLRFKPAAASRPSAAAVQQAAELLLMAERPFVLPGRVSRQKADWDKRIQLVESIGAGVVTDIMIGAAFPTQHPLHAAGPNMVLSEKAIDLLHEADVILSLDWVDLAGSLMQIYKTGPISAKIIHCSVDSYSHKGWSMDHQGLPPVDIPILSEPDVFVSEILKYIETQGRRKQPEVKDATHAVDIAFGAQSQNPEATEKSNSITLRGLGLALKQVLKGRKSCLIRLPIGWPADACDFRDPLDFLGGDGGGGIGSGPGMAVGAALALQKSDHLPIAVLGDGDYLMGISALWTAAHYRIPLLIIVANNRSYRNCEDHQTKIAAARERPVKNTWIGQRLDDPAVDLAALARAQGLDAEGPIADYSSLKDALTRAIATVEKDRGCVVDVVIEK